MSSCPAGPTNGRPVSSSTSPGPSPTKRTDAWGVPLPEHQVLPGLGQTAAATMACTFRSDFQGEVQVTLGQGITSGGTGAGNGNRTRGLRPGKLTLYLLCPLVEGALLPGREHTPWAPTRSAWGLGAPGDPHQVERLVKRCLKRATAPPKSACRQGKEEQGAVDLAYREAYAMNPLAAEDAVLSGEEQKERFREEEVPLVVGGGKKAWPSHPHTIRHILRRAGFTGRKAKRKPFYPAH